MDINSYIDISKSLLTPIIAILGVYIAYQQWITNERIRKQELYELRRNYLYSKCLEMIYNVPRIAKEISKDKLNEKNIIFKFAKCRAEYKFLITEEDDTKLENLFIEILKEINKIASAKTENIDFHIQQYETNNSDSLKKQLNSIFTKYLRIENKNIIQKLFPTIFKFGNIILNLLSTSIRFKS